MDSFKNMKEKKSEQDPLSSLFSLSLENLRQYENKNSSSIEPLIEKNIENKKSVIIIIDQNPRELEFYRFYFPNSELLLFNNVNDALRRITNNKMNLDISQILIDDNLYDVPAPIIVSLIKKLASDLKKEIIIIVSYKEKIDLKRYNPKPDIIIEKETGEIYILGI